MKQLVNVGLLSLCLSGMHLIRKRLDAMTRNLAAIFELYTPRIDIGCRESQPLRKVS